MTLLHLKGNKFYRTGGYTYTVCVAVLWNSQCDPQNKQRQICSYGDKQTCY